MCQTTILDPSGSSLAGCNQVLVATDLLSRGSWFGFSNHRPNSPAGSLQSALASFLKIMYAIVSVRTRVTVNVSLRLLGRLVPAFGFQFHRFLHPLFPDSFSQNPFKDRKRYFI